VLGSTRKRGETHGSVGKRGEAHGWLDEALPEGDEGVPKRAGRSERAERSEREDAGLRCGVLGGG